jgi:alanyl-tRNA synthetase
MGDTGPCGPCSELHVDLTPNGDTQGALVNQGTPRCIEIWNLVFIQFNANPDGTFTPLPAKSVDTGMGFERVTAIMQGTRNFTDFNRVISNYETDIFRPIFSQLEQLSGEKYRSTLPDAQSAIRDPQSAIDIAFRVIADHIRTLSFAVADGIQPGNTDRHYVLRRILRRAVRYGRSLGFHEPFFYKLVDIVAETMGDVFPEIRAHKGHVQEVIRVEEEAFNKTLDRGIEMFNEEAERLLASPPAQPMRPQIPGPFAFKLYDTEGFPLDLTELMARERGLTVDIEGFNKLMEEQRERARKAQKKEVIELSQIDSATPTTFVGYDTLETPATVLEVISLKDKTAVILNTSACYAEMGGQVGDTGQLRHGGRLWRIVNTQKAGNSWLHLLEETMTGDSAALPIPGMEVALAVDLPRRQAIQRHHTVTHLLHWALRHVLGQATTQKGSFVGPDKLTFDFNSGPLTPAQVNEVERLVTERILENASVWWTQMPFAQIKHRKDVMQFFGEKYGDLVRVIQIGGSPGQLNGYSMELCGGTHARATGEIGPFRILSESAIAAGVRRIEAVAGLCAYQRNRQEAQLLSSLAGKVNSPVGELERKLETLLAQQKELEKQLKSQRQRQAAATAKGLIAKAQMIQFAAAQAPVGAIIQNLGEVEADFLHSVLDALKDPFKGVVVLGGTVNGSAALAASVSAEFTKQVQAGKIIQTIAPIVAGKGGGKPDFARGSGKDPAKLDEALTKARALLT